MLAEQLREWWQAAPFVPVRIVLPGGRRLDVIAKDLLSISPSRRIAQLWTADEDFTQFEVSSVARVEARLSRKSAKRWQRRE
jgi:hypothetical protein